MEAKTFPCRLLRQRVNKLKHNKLKAKFTLDEMWRPKRLFIYCSTKLEKKASQGKPFLLTIG
jgi:hypothetical protein